MKLKLVIVLLFSVLAIIFSFHIWIEIRKFKNLSVDSSDLEKRIERIERLMGL